MGLQAAELADRYREMDLSEDDLHRCAELVAEGRRPRLRRAGGHDGAPAGTLFELAADADAPLAVGVRGELEQVARYVTDRTR